MINSVKESDYQFLKPLDKIHEYIDTWYDAGLFIAGGSLRSLLLGEKPKDFDIFFKDEQTLSIVQSELVSRYPHKTFGHVTNIVTPHGVLQLIGKYFFNDPHEIIEHFDFTCIGAVYDGENLYTHDRFFVDNAQKRLVLINDNVVFPLSTIKRALKYSNRGYLMCPVGLSIILKLINNNPIDWNNPDQNSIDFYPDGTPTFRGFD